MNKTLEKLSTFQKKGYLFHGSSKENLEYLEPRKTSDVDASRTFNIDTAVFATPHFLFTIPFGCISNIIKEFEVPEFITWSIGFKDGHPLVQSDFNFTPEMLKVSGFVYVLPIEPFVVSDLKGIQYKSFEKVMPITVVSVTLADFTAGGGLLEYKFP